MSIKDKFKNIFNKNKKIEVVEINENGEKENGVKTEKEIFTEKIPFSQRLQKISEKSFVLIRYAVIILLVSIIFSLGQIGLYSYIIKL